MGLDYSYLLFFKRQDPWKLLEGVMRFADAGGESHTPVLFPDRILRLPFEAWAGTEKRLPIPYDDPSKSWEFMTSLFFEQDEALRNYSERYREDGLPEGERVSVGYIYLTVYNDWSGYGREGFDPNLILLQFAAASTSMSILFSQSSSMRAAFTRLLEDYQGVYGLIDRENDAVLFWLRGEEMEEEIMHAWMPLHEIEAFLYGRGDEE